MRNNLRNARLEAGLSGGQVAKIVYISDSLYYRIEKGERPGYPDTWERLEELFNLPQEVLRENVEG